METVNNYVVNSPPLIPISTTHVEVLKPAPSIRISGQVQPSSTTYLATSNAYPVQKVEVKQVVPTIATSIVQPRQSFLRFNYIDPKLAQYQY